MAVHYDQVKPNDNKPKPAGSETGMLENKANITVNNDLPVVMLCYLICSLQWRHNGRDGISNHQSHHCLLNCLFRRRSKKTSKLLVTGLCAKNSPVTSEFPAQLRPVTRKMFPFDDGIMWSLIKTRHNGPHSTGTWHEAYLKPST